MQIKIFTIQLPASDKDMDELNQFLRSNKIISVERNFVTNESGSQIHFIISVNSNILTESAVSSFGNGKDDLYNTLSDEERTVFLNLKEIRKQLAEEKAVPVFQLFTNKQLVELTKISFKEKIEKKTLKKLNGVGKQKTNNYGERFLELYESRFGEFPYGGSYGKNERSNRRIMMSRKS